MSEAGDRLVLDYLQRVGNEALQRLRSTDRTKLLDELRQRIEQQRRIRGFGEDAVRAILAREGSPKAQVDDYARRMRDAIVDRADRAAEAERRTAAERVAAERAALERALQEQAAAERAAAEREAARREALDREQAERTAAERSERAAVERAAAERDALERAAEARAAAERAAPEPLWRGERDPAPVGAPAGPEGSDAAMSPRRAAAARALRRGTRVGRWERPLPEEDRNPLVVVVGTTVAAALVVVLLGWVGAFVALVVGLVLPRGAPRGARVVALLYAPLWLFAPFLLIALLGDAALVLGRVYPLVCVVLGSLYLHWAARRMPLLREVGAPAASESSP